MDRIGNAVDVLCSAGSDREIKPYQEVIQIIQQGEQVGPGSPPALPVALPGGRP